MQTIQTTAGQITGELQRRGINPAVPITVTIDPVIEQLWEIRAEVRPRIAAAGLSDDDIDALIAQARAEVAVEGK